MTTPANPDRGPSPRIIVAAILLRDGHDLDAVAELTGVPAALLTLARHEPPQHQRTTRTPKAAPPRQALATVAVIEVGAIVNAITSVLALTRHSPVLALLSSVGAVPLMVALRHLAERRTADQLANSSQLDESEGRAPVWLIHATQPTTGPRTGHSTGGSHRGWWTRW